MTEQGAQRRYLGWDRWIVRVDGVLRTLVGHQVAKRPNPARNITSEDALSPEALRISQGCMRVNHSGEVCAQALYEGQLVIARHFKTRDMLVKACEEEKDHLAWTHERLESLETHRSYLGFVWYSGAFLIGVLAGLLGDRWSLGFVEETERQVEAHLEGHLSRLPEADHRSRAIVAQMRVDEADHGAEAAAAGAYPLPEWVRTLMRLQATLMIRVAYWI